MEYRPSDLSGPSDLSHSGESAFSPVDIAEDDDTDDVGFNDAGFDDAGDDLLVSDEDDMVIVSEEVERVIVSDEDHMVIVAQEAAVGPSAVSPTNFSPAAETETETDNEMAASEIEMALEEIERELAEVELALERLGDGSYGRCENCGVVLSEEELESGPASRFCRAHLPFPSR